MKTIYSFLTVFLLSCFISIGVYADTYVLPATGNSEAGSFVMPFETPLSDTEQWTITAHTRYLGVPSDATWGSRLFHAYLVENPVTESGGFTSESKLCFYMRPPVGYPGATTSNTGKLLLANNVNNTPDVLTIDTENGTLFTFQIISDGTGTVLVNIRVEGNNGGNPYTKTYTNHEIGTVYGLAAGSHYDVEAEVTMGASDPILNKPADLNFRTIPLGATATKSLKVTGVNIQGTISGAISGTDIAAFNLKTASAPSNGELEIEFTPTAERTYEAQLALTSQGAEQVTLKITGQGGSLPLEISSENNSDEHWYYIHFARREGDAKVWTAVAKDDTISQSVLTPGNEAQQWKVYGDWDAYTFVGKTGIELSYNAQFDKYMAADREGGDYLGFVRYKDTQDWQVQNMDKSFMNKDTGDDVPGKNYINDFQGKSTCAYNIDDTGNQLAFIPLTAEKLFAGPDSLGFGTVTIGYPSTKKYPVVKLNITGNVECSFNGTDAGVFSAEITPDDSLFITLAPKEAIAYDAQLTVTAGSHSHTIKLTGTGFRIPALPFKVSDDTHNYWYQIQFDRNDDRRSKAIRDNGLDEILTQEAKEEDQDNQLWKITGTWDNYKIIAKSGREFKSNANPSTGDSRYVAGEAGTGHVFRLEEGHGGRWELYDKTLTGGNRYVNDNSGVQIGSWTDNNDGNPINFLPAFASIGAKDLPFYEIEEGASFTKELTVSSVSLTGVITYALSGADACAFTVTAVEDEDETTPVLEPSTLYQEGGALRITFAPTEKRAYSATLTFTAAGADPLEIALTGTADFVLPVKITASAIENWYAISFKRQLTKVLAVDELGNLAQVAKPTGEPTDAQQWKFTGTPAEGYRIVSKTGPAIVYASSLYGLSAEDAEGDKHQFIRASNGTDWQLYNRIADGSDEDGDNYRYLNDFGGHGESAGLYSANDAGNYLVFTFVSGETGIKTPDFAGDVITATRYYTLQGAQVKKPAQTGIYIKQDRYTSGRVTATKVYFVK